MPFDEMAIRSSTADLGAEGSDRLRFETLLADLIARFVNIPADAVDQEIAAAQRAICACLGLEHSSFWQVSPDDPTLAELTHLHRDQALPPMPPLVAQETFPWARAKTFAKEIVCVPDIAALPPEAARDQAMWQQLGIASVLVLPLAVGGGPLLGALSFEAARASRPWPKALQDRLLLLAQVFAGALDRKRADQKLRESEARLTLAAESANAGLWTLDPHTGQIWATSKALELYGWSPGEALDVARFFARVHPDDRDHVRQVIEQAMRSGHDVSVDYRILHPTGTRWIAARGRRQPGRAGEPDRLMGISSDITDAKCIEQELAALRERLQAESAYLQDEIVRGQFEEMVGQSPALQAVFQRIAQVAPTDTPVLIQGETGTGKELVARAIHRLSRRKDRVLVKVDCAALPASLIESELFGREKGAYTGALTKQMGRFEVAHGSTLFLDEIGELPLELQAKLLRVVQDGQFERLGSPKTFRVDVRLIAATNRDLGQRMQEGAFRQDLYYRLNVFPITVPPLRDRPEDVPLLTWAFVRELERKMGKRITTIPQQTMEALQRHAWPGNVRELRNLVEQALIVTSGSQLTVRIPGRPGGPATAALSSLKGVEHRHILAVLEQTGGRIKGPGGAAERLGMKPSTVYSTMQRLGISLRRRKDDIST